MSVVFECSMVKQPLDVVENALPLLERSLDLETLKVLPMGHFTVIYQKFDERPSFGPTGHLIANQLSRMFTTSALIRFDSRAAYRYSCVYSEGLLMDEFTIDSEYWRHVDDAGNVDESSDAVRTQDLKPSLNYRNVLDAIQLGFNEIGFDNKQDWLERIGEL